MKDKASLAYLKTMRSRHSKGMDNASLVPRSYAHACERVWLYKSKSLGSLQNLNMSSEMAKQIQLQLAALSQWCDGTIMRFRLQNFP